MDAVGALQEATDRLAAADPSDFGLVEEILEDRLRAILALACAVLTEESAARVTEALRAGEKAVERLRVARAVEAARLAELAREAYRVRSLKPPAAGQRRLFAKG